MYSSPKFFSLQKLEAFMKSLRAVPDASCQQNANILRISKSSQSCFACEKGVQLAFYDDTQFDQEK